MLEMQNGTNKAARKTQRYVHAMEKTCGKVTSSVAVGFKASYVIEITKSGNLMTWMYNRN